MTASSRARRRRQFHSQRRRILHAATTNIISPYRSSTAASVHIPPDWIIPDLIIYVAVQNATRHAVRASVGQPLLVAGYFFRDSAASVLRRRERNARRPFTPLSWRSVVVKTEQKRPVRVRCGRRSLFQRRPWSDGDGCGWRRRTAEPLSPIGRCLSSTTEQNRRPVGLLIEPVAGVCMQMNWNWSHRCLVLGGDRGAATKIIRGQVRKQRCSGSPYHFLRGFIGPPNSCSANIQQAMLDKVISRQ